uniref:Uncharacterized protein n=1 Tax=Ditylenchus dipsaci TaxID=166011 RepID=A0A915EGB5_9BILA
MRHGPSRPGEWGGGLVHLEALGGVGARIKKFVVKDSNEVVIGVRHPPKIQFRDCFTKTPDSVTTRWNDFNAHYISTKQISEWLFYYPKNHEKNICDSRAKFSETAKAKGMRSVMEKRRCLAPYTDDSLDFKSFFFAQCFTRKIEFVLFIDSEKNNTHADLKYYEARYKILTQAITEEYVAIQAELKKVDPAYKHQILYVVAPNGISSSSFLPSEKCPQESVIQNPFSSHLVENSISEAWMVSHKAVKVDQMYYHVLPATFYTVTQAAMSLKRI